MKFPKMNKKGMDTTTFIGLVVTLAAVVVILSFFINYSGRMVPALSGYSCGLNMRIDAAVLDNSKILGKSLIGAPIIMCNQWKKPVDIDAMNFDACPGIASFCDKPTGKLQEECWKQCARIQIDKLTDNCWSMAGSGKLDFTDTWLQGFVGTISDPFKLGSIILTGGVGWYLGGAFIGKLIIVGGIVGDSYFYGGTGEKVLRCYRFRITNPIVSRIDKKPINYVDDSLGRSWAYGLNTTNLNDPKYCKPSVENPMCSFGGTGVSNINELGEITYKISDKDIAVPTNDEELLTGRVLDYNISDPRNQICYITYHQANEGPKIGWTDKDGNKHEVKINNKYVVRSCEFWSAYSANPSYLN